MPIRTTAPLATPFTLALCILASAPGSRAQAPTAGTPPNVPADGQPVATGAPAAAAVKLPVRRVVLYKSGVGYFEHVGRVRGDQAVSIDLTSGQLDDVLKSLTTADLGSGRVTGITFNSTAPLEQRLRTLGLPLGATTSPADLLNALRGSRVEVQASGGAVIGRVLSIQAADLQRRQRAGAGTDRRDRHRRRPDLHADCGSGCAPGRSRDAG